MFKFMVYVDKRENTAMLCEGGVYTDDDNVLENAQYYRNHDFLKGEADVAFANAHSDQSYGTYELRDHWECRLDQLDMDVVSSLDTWQKDALKVTFIPDAGLPPPPKTPTAKDYFDEKFPNFVPKDLSRYWSLDKVGIDTACGQDCVAIAIDSGFALVTGVRTAHGTYPKGEEFVKTIGDIVIDICSVFIDG